MKLSRILITITFFLVSGCAPNNTLTPLTESTPPLEATEIATSTIDSHPLFGLTYRLDDTLWQFNQTGEQVKIAECAATSISGDGSIMASSIEGDIYLINPADCSLTNITNSPNQEEVNPIIWHNNPDLIAYVIDPSFSGGKLAISNIDREEIFSSNILIPNPESFSLSPTKNEIAIFNGDTAIIANVLTDETASLNPKEFTPKSTNVLRMDNPAWSPDGTKIAWVARVESKNPNQEDPMAVIVFDLETSKIIYLFSYSPAGMGGWPPAPVWSADGEWLVFNAWAQDSAEQGFWIASADGKEITKIDIPELIDLGSAFQAHPPLWSADGSLLVLGVINYQYQSFLIDTDTMESSPLSIPSKGVFVGWVN